MPNINIGVGWNRVMQLKAPESLILRAFDHSARRHNWLCMNVTTSTLTKLESGAPKHGMPLYIDATKELVYASAGGISSFCFSGHKERLLLSLDTESVNVERMWATDEGTAEKYSLVYVLCKQQPSMQQVAERFIASGRMARTSITKQCSIYTWTRGGGSPIHVCAFGSNPAFVDMNKSSGQIYASLGNKELIQIDLAMGKSTIIARSKKLTGLTISPKGALIIWDMQDEGISKFLPNGKKEVLIPFGWFPAISPDEQYVAFTRNDNELWLRHKEQEPACIVTSSRGNPAPNTGLFDAPTWCCCGRHFAVSLMGSGNSRQPERFLVVCDVSSREFMIIDNPEHSLSDGGRIWIPGDLGE